MRPKKATANGTQTKNRQPKWKRHLDDYGTGEVIRLKFASRNDSDAAIDLVWAGRLRGMPFALDPNDTDSLLVPNAGIPYFQTAGIRFTSHPVVSSRRS